MEFPSAPLPPDFSGPCRLFPLPNLVLFPHVVQPLRIFEPRYREMLKDALDGDGLIGIFKLRPDWETSYHQRPAIEAVGCLGRVVAHSKLLNGESNILLAGVRRVRLEQELTDADTPYRQARVRVLEDRYQVEDAERRRDVHRALSERFRRLIPPDDAAQEQVAEMFSGDVPLGRLTDLIAFASGLEISFLQQMLEELEVERRAQRLLERLEEHLPPGPWTFSNN